MKAKYLLSGIIILHIVLFGIVFQVQADDSSLEMKEDKDKDKKEFRILYDFDPNDEFSSVETPDVYNTYFKLDIGYSIILEGEEDETEILLNITVRNEIEMFYDDTLETRIVTEEEYEDGEIVEISYNYFALHVETNDVIYFGELSIEYEDGEPVGTAGSWRADDEGNLPGIIMPGDFVKHDRYYQEYAPGVAEDRAENIKVGKKIKADLETFQDCVVVEETNPLEPDALEYKIYAPLVGIIADEDLWITDYGYVNV
jgi:hypothetical protein